MLISGWLLILELATPDLIRSAFFSIMYIREEKLSFSLHSFNITESSLLFKIPRLYSRTFPHFRDKKFSLQLGIKWVRKKEEGVSSRRKTLCFPFPASNFLIIKAPSSSFSPSHLHTHSSRQLETASLAPFGRSFRGRVLQWAHYQTCFFISTSSNEDEATAASATNRTASLIKPTVMRITSISLK